MRKLLSSPEVQYGSSRKREQQKWRGKIIKENNSRKFPGMKEHDFPN